MSINKRNIDTGERSPESPGPVRPSGTGTHARHRRELERAAEAQAIVAHAREEAERIAAQAARDLQQSLERRQRLAEERIAQAESKAIDEIRAAAVDVAIDAARRVIVSELDERRGAAMLDTAIASLPQRLRQ